MQVSGEPAAFAEKAAQAFLGEQSAYTLYSLMARVAQNEGQRFAAKVFRESAGQELTHAEIFSQFFEEGDLSGAEAEETPPPIRGTIENLRAAADDEREDMVKYAEYAEQARRAAGVGQPEEDTKLAELAEVFRAFSAAERYHRARFLELARILEAQKSDRGWRCLHCGYFEQRALRPEACPGCLATDYWKPLFFEASLAPLLPTPPKR